ncbi:MAG: prepilin peptidase [Geminicoccaceae bacterium]
MTSIIFSGFSALLLLACYYDIMQLRIPNVLSLLLLGLFGLRYLLDEMRDGLSDHLLGMLIAFVILFPLFAYRLLGGGDVKLMTVSALWVGMPLLLEFFFSTAVIGGIVAGLFLLARLAVDGGNNPDRLPASLRKGAAIPYGIPIALSAWLLGLGNLATMRA